MRGWFDRAPARRARLRLAVKGGIALFAALEPLGEVAAFDVIAFQEKRRVIQPDVEQLGDVVAVAERFLEQPEQGQLALERTQPVRVEAEFEDALLLGLRVPHQPDFAEAAFAQLAVDHPARLAGDFQSQPWPPAERLLLFDAQRPLGLRRVARRPKRREADRTEYFASPNSTLRADEPTMSVNMRTVRREPGSDFEAGGFISTCVTGGSVGASLMDHSVSLGRTG